MKRICCLLLLCCISSVISRINAQAFIRIYGHHGKKIGRGEVALIADTVIVIENAKKHLQRFRVADISFIKTKRSAGSGLVSGFGIGFLGSAFIAKGAMSVGVGDQAIGIIMISGTAAGTIAGFVTGIATKRHKFVIDGSPEKWKAQERYWFALLANDLELIETEK